MRYCITGGLGFVGSSLTRRLIQNGHAVHVIDNMTGISPASETFIEEISLHKADVCDSIAIQQAMEIIQPEVCIHLAAMHYIPACNADPVKAMEVNVMGTAHVLHACERTSVPHTIVMSSGAIYADSNTALSESSSIIAPADIYGMTKLQAEELTQQFSKRQPDRKFSIIRLFNVYGPGETNPHILPEIMQQLRHSDELYLGNINPERDFIHVEDVVSGILSLENTTHTSGYDTFNLCSGRAFSMQAIIEMIGSITGRNITVHTDPARWRKADKQCQLGDNNKLMHASGFSSQIGMQEGLIDLLKHEGLI